jgi:hypothetical protein
MPQIRFGAKGGNQNHKLSHAPRTPQEVKTQKKTTGQANARKDRKNGDVRFGHTISYVA